MTRAMQVARVAAQLREAARDMARVAARRTQAGTEPAEMPCPETNASAAGIEHIPPEFVHLLATALHELDQHINDCGLCAVCGCAWPCERAEIGRGCFINSLRKGGTDAQGT